MALEQGGAGVFRMGFLRGALLALKGIEEHPESRVPPWKQLRRAADFPNTMASTTQLPKSGKNASQNNS